MEKIVHSRDAAQEDSATNHAVSGVVAAVRATFDSGRTRSVTWRLHQLEAIERLLSENEQAIAEAVGADLGRDAYATWLAEILAVNMDNRHVRRHLRKWVKPQHSAPPLSFRGLARVAHQSTPKGVVLIIGPWNYPIFLLFAPLISALAAGNTVVLKPSELAPATARLIADLVPKYLDPSAIRVVEGGPEETQALIAEGLDHVFFTGGERIGKLVARAAAEHLSPVTLELGGKSPTIVAKDANLTVAARRIVATKLINAGQTCVAPDYVLVEREVMAEFTAKLVAEFNKQRTDAGQDLRVAHRKHAEHIARLLESSGGELVLPGLADSVTLKVEPVVVVDPDLDSPLMQEEIFGPILPIVPMDSITEATQFIRVRPRPLAVYVFTSSRRTQRQVIAQTLSGSVVTNQAVYQVAIPTIPFGGTGASGYGTSRGKFGFDEFSHKRALMAMRTFPDLPLLYPPFTTVKRWLARVMIR
ncbi:aldehyde dehydrogenase family protein [Mycobacteroides abscessus]|uniref:aldehyde dehydrogenase family protein n=1 Tax=Mycobacteroides abscessus TaxID=36809 RepID=UPI000C2574AF|nr:aldehyde dehydrogenase family protein [Mycobacteroides abscessus]